MAAQTDSLEFDKAWYPKDSLCLGWYTRLSTTGDRLIVYRPELRYKEQVPMQIYLLYPGADVLGGASVWGMGSHHQLST